MTEEMKKTLVKDFGLTFQQVNSTTADKLVTAFMGDAEKELVKEANRQVDEMRSILNKLSSRFSILSDSILKIAEAQEEYGEINDERGRNALIFYAAMLKLNDEAGADADISVKEAGTVLFAYLGGQARGNTTNVELCKGDIA